jgi:hypothetical protein
MRDSLALPIEGAGSLIIATDNSGGIGMKQADDVLVSYDITAYFSFRVAVMECIAAGANPIAVVVHNFCGDEAWNPITQGILRGQAELKLDIPITGSTESNITMIQSALGIIVVGKTMIQEKETGEKIAVIGQPLVGSQVIDQAEFIAPLPLFKWCCEQEGINVLPVGSKGIAYEWRLLQPDSEIPAELLQQLDVQASAGPSTCFLISYPKSMEKEIKEKAGVHFYGY